MRLVSLWWELPPRLDSNIRILFGKMQQFFVGSLNFFLPPRTVSVHSITFQRHTSGCKEEGGGLNPPVETPRQRYTGFWTTTPAHSSKTRIAEQKSSSPQP